MRIGIFDSGLGGLVMLRTLLRSKLRNYDFVYLGDTRNLPYGEKSQTQIYKLTKRAVEFLFQQDCALVIIACNTASSQALRKLQQEYLPKSKYADRKILGVIRPTVEVLGKVRTVGLIGTRRTIDSSAYSHELAHVNPKIKLFAKATPKLVLMLESNKFNRKVLERYLKSFPKIQVLILGCTHYGLVKHEIRKIMGPKVKVIAQEDIIPNKLQAYLQDHPEIETRLSKRRRVEILVTKSNGHYRKLLLQWFGKDVKLKTA